MNNKSGKPVRHPQPFPWFCSTCGKDEVRPAIIQHTATVKHHGRKHVVEIPNLPVLRCDSCGEILMENNSHEKILYELRRKEGLLQPGEIRKGRKDRGLKQRDFAKEIQAAATTVCKWESGVIIQSRRADRTIRDFFARTPVNGNPCDSASQNHVDELLRSIFHSCAEEVRAELFAKMTAHEIATNLTEKRSEICRRMKVVLKDCISHSSSNESTCHNAFHFWRTVSLEVSHRHPEECYLGYYSDKRIVRALCAYDRELEAPFDYQSSHQKLSTNRISDIPYVWPQSPAGHHKSLEKS
jgi:DNA-binding transcriptional regulator YiaG